MQILGCCAALCGLLLIGCIAKAPPGRVVMKVNERSVHLTLGDGEVKPGDRVSFYDKQCTGMGKSLHCQWVAVGKGTVTETFSSVYSAARVDPGVLVVEDMPVGKAEPSAE